MKEIFCCCIPKITHHQVELTTSETTAQQDPDLQTKLQCIRQTISKVYINKQVPAVRSQPVWGVKTVEIPVYKMNQGRLSDTGERVEVLWFDP